MNSRPPAPAPMRIRVPVLLPGDVSFSAVDFIFCPACGHELTESALRCSDCGTPFKGSKARQALTPRVKPRPEGVRMDADGELDVGGVGVSFSFAPVDEDEPTDPQSE